jgi:hypothetical protein
MSEEPTAPIETAEVQPVVPVEPEALPEVQPVNSPSSPSSFPPRYPSMLANPTPTIRPVKPDWVFWVRYHRGYVVDYDLMDWSIRIGFLVLGLIVGWFAGHAY